MRVGLKALPSVAATAVGLGTGTLACGYICRAYGTAGAPQVHIPSGTSPSFGYSFSVETIAPPWASAVAIICGLGSAGIVWRLARRRS